MMMILTQMKYLPKKKKGKAEAQNFIEVKADDLRSDSNEWVKNITDEVSFKF